MDPFARLPEECISTILSLTSPMDATRFSIVSHRFKSASDSDNVWERFLPPDYQQIISTSASPVSYATKKDLYFTLYHSSILLHEGNTVSTFLYFLYSLVHSSLIYVKIKHILRILTQLVYRVNENLYKLFAVHH